jgi:hypothetical protein
MALLRNSILCLVATATALAISGCPRPAVEEPAPVHTSIPIADVTIQAVLPQGWVHSEPYPGTIRLAPQSAMDTPALFLRVYNNPENIDPPEFFRSGSPLIPYFDEAQKVSGLPLEGDGRGYLLEGIPGQTIGTVALVSVDGLIIQVYDPNSDFDSILPEIVRQISVTR